MRVFWQLWPLFLPVPGICSFAPSDRSELRAALRQWHEADEAAKQQLTERLGAPGTWNVSAVTNMSGIFKGLRDFNEDIGSWETSSVLDMTKMLARGAWSLRGAVFATAVSGFRDCARSCDASNCSSFLLDSSGSCWFEPKDLRRTGEGSTLAFLRASCSTFSCPPGTHPRDDRRSPIGPVTAASCCACSAANRVPNATKAPDLQCVTCPAGTAPAATAASSSSSADRCEPCPSGRFAKEASTQCEPCPAGVPTSRHDGCKDCPPGQYAEGGACEHCWFPFILQDDTCMWWHLPVILAFLLVGSGFLFLVLRAAKAHQQRRNEKRGEAVNSVLRDLEQELWNEKADTVQRYVLALSSFGWTEMQVDAKAAEIRAKQSAHAGVSMSYLLTDFAQLARERSGEEDPTFIRLKEAFWLGDTPLGKDVRCPRDGRPGCALVDLLPPQHRQMQDHFMSWSWKYSLGQVQSALRMWRSAAPGIEEAFFYMCFFVNNQHRIIIEGSAAGSDNLDEVFKQNLLRIGRVVAILDAWHEPVYLKRVWTIYEQYLACSLEIPVTFVMPRDATVSLSQQDEEKVKQSIVSTVGFQRVNQHVKGAMVHWIGAVVKQKFQDLVNQAEDETFTI
ncbi:ANKS1A [Symbiodinium necroappetens]|uniref:ANKS1A protein n=1 Tax=Symbiodinium necroappetens TaxID=1628268 RepID=A0A812ZKY2_9DINO|nr:ANKS1A [Symbiodinium necroappetens]